MAKRIKEPSAAEVGQAILDKVKWASDFTDRTMMAPCDKPRGLHPQPWAPSAGERVAAASAGIRFQSRVKDGGADRPDDTYWMASYGKNPGVGVHVESWSDVLSFAESQGVLDSVRPKSGSNYKLQASNNQVEWHDVASLDEAANYHYTRAIPTDPDSIRMQSILDAEASKNKMLSHSESVDAELTFLMPPDASANLKLQELTLRLLAGLRDDLAALVAQIKEPEEN